MCKSLFKLQAYVCKSGSSYFKVFMFDIELFSHVISSSFGDCQIAGMIPNVWWGLFTNTFIFHHNLPLGWYQDVLAVHLLLLNALTTTHIYLAEVSQNYLNCFVQDKHKFYPESRIILRQYQVPIMLPYLFPHLNSIRQTCRLENCWKTSDKLTKKEIWKVFKLDFSRYKQKLNNLHSRFCCCHFLFYMLR